jgi:hypothetical protein
MSLLENENNTLTKQKLDSLLKNNFTKMRSKDKKVIYVKISKSSTSS